MKRSLVCLVSVQSHVRPAWRSEIRRLLFALLVGSSALMLALSVTPQSIAAEEQVAGMPSEALRVRLKPLIDAHQGQVAVAVKHLKNGEVFIHNAERPMPTASLIKLPVMIETYRQIRAGKLKADQSLTLKEGDKVQGSGILTTHFSAGLTLSLRDTVRLMVAYSDNTATNLVVDQIGLPSTAATMESLGYPNTKLNAKVFHAESSIAPERSREFGLGSTTASEMLNLLEQLELGKLPGVSESDCADMLEHLEHCESRSMIPRYLPSGTKVAHKTGSVSAVRCDAGIIRLKNGSVVLCALTAANTDQRWTESNEAEVLIAEIAREVFEHFQQGDAAGEDGMPLDVLKTGAEGELVSALQRTLNSRMKPSPGLTVDGEFGPATRTAVMEFQKQNKLKPDGIVSASTWGALSPILFDDPMAVTNADPDAKEPSRTDVEPRDSLEGPPFVTAPAWAIGDAKSGKLLWAQAGDRQVEMASTTKIMTALVTLELARANAGLLDEMVTFSKAADVVEGSASGLRAGEKTTVRNLLYGLMLPSGNDAALALAESLGKRFAPAGTAKSGSKKAVSHRADPVSHFVAQMNRTAARLGMTQTRFRNPHGLPASGHVSSAADLLKLTSEALMDPLFRDVVKTREYKLRVSSGSGYSRDVVWKSTNKLLDIDGYRGIKTGWTTDAGACLVALGERDDDELVVVVLGSSTSNARYVDTRNLFRWGWQQRRDSGAGAESTSTRKARVAR